jgi:hypothetical protein
MFVLAIGSKRERKKLNDIHAFGKLLVSELQIHRYLILKVKNLKRQFRWGFPNESGPQNLPRELGMHGPSEKIGRPKSEIGLERILGIKTQGQSLRQIDVNLGLGHRTCHPRIALVG